MSVSLSSRGRCAPPVPVEEVDYRVVGVVDGLAGRFTLYAVLIGRSLFAGTKGQSSYSFGIQKKISVTYLSICSTSIAARVPPLPPF